MWDLVDREIADDPSDRSDSRIVGHLEQRSVPLALTVELGPELLGVEHHGSELEHLEWDAVSPDSLLTKEDRPAVLELDGSGDDEVSTTKVE